MMRLKYHQQSFELVNVQPEFTGEVFSNMPTSVAEWYSLAGSLQLLEKFSNEDVPANPSEFKTGRHNEKELAVFLYENQGVFWWTFEQGDSDVPPVYVNLDPPPDRWALCCEKFSDFVFTRLFDFYHWHDYDLMTLGFGKALEQSVLDLLRSEYISHPVTYSGISETQYPFSSQNQKITIHEHNSKSSWYLSADSPAGVRNLLEKFDDMLNGHHPPISGS